MPAASDRPTASAEDYAATFEGNPRGARVLEDLMARFGGVIYVKGGLEGDRETCYRAGSRRVLDHVLAQINRANGAPDPNDEET